MRRTAIAASISILLLTAAGGAQTQAPLADKLPEGSLAYFGWAGKTLTLDGSAIGQFIQEPEIKQIVAAIHAGIVAHANAKEDRAIFERLWSMGAIAWEHPAAAALFDLNLPEPPAAGARLPKAEPKPIGALLIDLGKDRQAFEEQLTGLMSVVGEKLKAVTKSANGASYWSVPTPAGPAALGFVGNIFFAAIGEKAPDIVFGLVGGKGKALSADAKFAGVLKEMAGEHLQCFSYVDVSRVYDLINKLSPASGPSSIPAGNQDIVQVNKIIDALGLRGVTAIAEAANLVDKGVQQRTRIFSPAPHQGVLMLLAGEPLAANALAGIPADAEFMVALNLDPAKLLTEVKRAAAAISPDASMQINTGLAMAGAMLGLDVEKDLLASLGNQWTLYGAPSVGGFLSGTILSCQIKDAKKFNEVLGKLEALAKQQLGQPAETAPALAPAKAGPQIVSYKPGKTEIHYVFMPDVPSPVAPAWAVADNKLYIAAWPQVIAAALESAEKPLGDEPTFVGVRKRLSNNLSSLAYVNTPAVMRKLYGALLAGGTAGANMASGKLGLMLKPEIIPPLPKLEKYLAAEISGVSSDNKGITIESYQMTPLSALGMQSVALSVSTLLPVLNRARENAKRAVSGANLNGIAKGIAIYQADNADAFPPDLQALVKAGVIGPAVLYSPLSGRKPVDGKAVEPFDYVYLGKGLPATVDPKLIIAYERPELNRNGGTQVLFADFHVEWMTMPEFQKALAATQEYLKKNAKDGKSL